MNTRRFLASLLTLVAGAPLFAECDARQAAGWVAALIVTCPGPKWKLTLAPSRFEFDDATLQIDESTRCFLCVRETAEEARSAVWERADGEATITCKVVSVP